MDDLDNFNATREKERRIYKNARAEHALRCRLEGMLWREVGERLGLSTTMAITLAGYGSRRRNSKWKDDP